MIPNLRVVVVGNSCASYVRPARTTRGEGAYSDLLERHLEAKGITAQVSLRSRWLGVVRDLRREYEQVVRDARPDVVIVHFGIVDCQPNALPLWLVRHLATWNRSGRTSARAYRKLLANPAWPAFRKWQQLLSAAPTYRVRPKAFRAELTRMIAITRLETRALVLLLDIDPIGDSLEHWMPGLVERRARYQLLLREVTERFGPDVRLVSASEQIVDRVQELLPDGIHRTAEGHRLLAAELAEVITAWSRETDGPGKDDPQGWV